MTFFRSFGCLALLLVVGGCATDPQFPRTSEPLASSSPEVQILLQEVRQDDADIIVVNKSGEMITWETYPTTPSFRVRKKDIFGWHEIGPEFVCGKGSQEVQLKPNDSKTLTAFFNRSPRFPIQVGLYYARNGINESPVVWSPPFTTK